MTSVLYKVHIFSATYLSTLLWLGILILQGPHKKEAMFPHHKTDAQE